MTLRRLTPDPAVSAIVALALVVRVVVVLTTPHFAPQSDAAQYDWIAQHLAQHGSFPPSLLVPGNGATAFRPPAFPIALAAVYKLVGAGVATTRWEAGRLFEAALGAVSVWLIYEIAKRLWNRTVGLVSAAIASVYAPLVLVGSSLMSESLFIPLVLGAVLAALRQRETGRRWRWLIAGGVLVGLGALSRSSGIAMILPVVFLVWTGRPRLRWSSLRDPLVVICATALTLVPWTVRNAVDLHAFVPISTETGYALEGTYNPFAQHRTDYPALWQPPVSEMVALLHQHPGLDEAQMSDRLTSEALRFIGHHPAYLAKVGYWSTLRLLNLTGTKYERLSARFEGYPVWLASLSVYFFWALALLGLLGALVYRAGRSLGAVRPVPWALWACPVVLFVPNMLFLGSTRYRAPADPFIVMLAALGTLWVARRLGIWRDPGATRSDSVYLSGDQAATIRAA